ncbi:hypothetical protein QCD60_26730 [Pokkaliibacter sp. MBI-7]|uniref:hypothetical protein n=1 Tax=Pokkaliibacter sp. MBI-7 TaxID=3040600 RepID=UPI002449C391|nr:hypothetical protein [Pokkaliibacter sp. MBI-7]MDH2436131.1 hypothetical protein [Pokkaliibacter sp. MBI-7]
MTIQLECKFNKNRDRDINTAVHGNGVDIITILKSNSEHIDKISLDYSNGISYTVDLLTLRIQLGQLAIYEAKINHDIKRAKELYYLSALAIIKALEHSTATFVLGGTPCLPEFALPLVCDATTLYPLFAQLTEEKSLALAEQGSWASIMRCYQAALIKDWAEIERMIAILQKKFAKLKANANVVYYIEFFQALLNNNTDDVEASLRTLLTPPLVVKQNSEWPKRSHEGEYMCHFGMPFAKLAWILGHEIEIQHPLIVSELLPVRPLEHYHNPYPFLEPAESTWALLNS